MKISFHKKLFLSISVTMGVLMLFCISAFSFYAYGNLYKESMNNLSHLSDRTGSELTTLFQNMDQLALYASTSPEVRHAFTKARKKALSDSDLSKETKQILSSISIPNNSSHFRITLYNRKGNFTSIGIPYQKKWISQKLTSSDYQRWYDSLPLRQNGSSVFGFHPDFWSDTNQLYLSLFREIFDEKSTSTVTGIIEIQCPYSIVENLLDFEDTSYSCYLYNRAGELAFTNAGAESLPRGLYDNYKDGGTGILKEDARLLYCGNTVRNDFDLILVQSEAHIWRLIFPQILAVLFMGIGALAITTAAIFYITKRVTQPLRDLTSSVKQVSLSNLSLELNFTDYSDEISGLNRAFDKMFTRLKQSMDENVKMQACEMKANMVALQAQMDPHFLYNILTIIKALCREQNTRQISLTCDYLVKMLRYISAYDDHNISLKQELKHTENYLNLMKIRYEDQFTYTFFIDSNVDTEGLLIPKLTLQPLVENCFQHGFKTVAPPWEIRIRFWAEDFRWFVSVADNGAGISDETKAAIYDEIDEFLSHPSESITSLKIGGMGLVNTVARLKLRYKEQISFKILSPTEGGTSIILGGMLNHEYLGN